MTPSSWFFIFALACCLPQMLDVAMAEEQGEGCSAAKSCGNLTISDPFWLIDTETGKSCGSDDSPDFEVACYNNTPVLQSFEPFGFVIIRITYEEHSLRVVDLGKLEFLQARDSCNVFPTWNTSAKLSRPFRIDSGNLDLILYNCTGEAAAVARRQDKALVETRMRCGNQSEVFVRAAGSYNETSDHYAGYAVEGCDAIVMPVSGEANASAMSSSSTTASV